MALVFVVTGHALLFKPVEYQTEFEKYFKKPTDIKTLVKFANDTFETIACLKKLIKKPTMCKFKLRESPRQSRGVLMIFKR
jgi:hypothetical protein